ncbi:ABC transporter ATP-binding protein [Pectobacterium polonicum]|uniref:Spermidine/putrescine import ATP-binding protein PotA n=1 Tax=Pectobacterium polonicum TaxID=2485124 RepID=A0ABV1P9T6_9GAMM|nr:ABC transporter ATP-binding protein [Pectobacterium polonicum]MDC9818524.1 ABC transporter ATP-binding protein [Pectobacterium polonicum]TKY80364.1 ABC transporter ATP-binding protein [Pectobacterium polonicum]
MSAVSIDTVVREFDAHRALDGVSLEIAQGEFFSLLGPSGCGKTTLLNIIAGFLAPTAGRVCINGQDITDWPPYRRNIGMVFQNYALFPHLSVEENVAYGLKVRRVNRQEQQRRVKEALDQVRLEGLATRRPHQLSGGQQQRVAIARALAIEPQVLLLDEPLSNLDARLRKVMQDELRALQQRVGITTVLVTHDQEEALTLSDRIGVLGHGRLQQLGSPWQLYHAPENRFVAEFIGQANLLTVSADAASGHYVAQDHFVAVSQPLRIATTTRALQAQRLMIRPERIALAFVPPEGRSGVNQTDATVKQASYAGASVRLTCQLPGGGELLVQADEQTFSRLPAIGEACFLHWQVDDVVILPAEGDTA